MAEEFLEPIYKEAKLLCELRQMAEWTKVQDEHHTFLTGNAIMPELCDLCKGYVEQDKIRCMQLWDALQDFSRIKGDLLLLGDRIEHRMIPLLEERMKQWGEIRTENEEGDYLFESTVSGFLTIKDLNRGYYYHSTVDPMWEARKLAESFFDPKKDSYSILGCGLGYLPYQLYLISEGSIVINVFEKDARMVEYARSYGVLDWIPEDRINVMIEEDVLSFLYSAEDGDVGYYMMPYAFRREAEDVRPALETLVMEDSTRKKFGRNVDINFWRNIKSDCKHVSEFDTSTIKKEVVVIAAGPSLDDSMDFIKESRGKRTLIAVGTVFKKLLENDITPDIVAILDPQNRTYKQIEGLEEQQVPMLIAMSAYWKFAAAYQGEKYLVPCSQTKEISDYTREHNQTLWGCGGTVTSLALDAAIRFGAEQIYLVGVDLSFPNGVSHATGTMDRKTTSTDNLIPVEGVDEQTVYTTRAFLVYKDWMEGRMAMDSHIKYYNMSKVGIKIAGTIDGKELDETLERMRE